MEDDVRKDTIEEAKKIKEYQGDHETEISCGGEADFLLHKKQCKKNPEHREFIPLKDFQIEHLPADYRDKDVADWIIAEADLTCRLAVRFTSELRPKYIPDTQQIYPYYKVGGRAHRWIRSGTGWMEKARKYTERDNMECKCKECSEPGANSPKKVWGEIRLVTACHVVFNSEEARHTTCSLFYDTSSTDITQCPTLAGVMTNLRDIKGDRVVMTCVTHDMDFFDELEKKFLDREEKWKNVSKKYGPEKNIFLFTPEDGKIIDFTPGPVVIISHPHGCSKHITLGMWTRKTDWAEPVKNQDNGWEAYQVSCSYNYNAHTCPGSSGAPVIKLPVKGRWWWSCHPHSTGHPGNNNMSGAWGESVSPSIPSSLDVVAEELRAEFPQLFGASSDFGSSLVQDLKELLEELG